MSDLAPLPADIPPLEGIRHLLINLHDSLPPLSGPFDLDDALDAVLELDQHSYYIHRELDRYIKEAK